MSLKLKEVAVSQGMEVVEVVSRSWKSQENSSSPRASSRNLALEKILQASGVHGWYWGSGVGNNDGSF